MRTNTCKEITSTNGNSEHTTDQHSNILTYTPEEAYSRCLTPKHKLEYNGYMLKESKWKKTLLGPIRFVFPKKPKQPGSLVLVRHGETEWNRNQTFIGWADPDLTNSGIQQAEHAARLLIEGGYDIDVVFTSRLTRAIRSTWSMLREMNQVYLPIYKSWRLNDQNCGSITGLSIETAVEQFGEKTVQAWRGERKGSMKSKPPPLKLFDEHWVGKQRRYFDLQHSELPMTESLLDLINRAKPIYENQILSEIKNGRNVLVVTHKNCVRGLIKIIDDIDDDDFYDLKIPPGIPIVYKFDEDMKPIKSDNTKNTNVQTHMNGIFLEKPGLLEKAMKDQSDLMMSIRGYNRTTEKTGGRLTTLEAVVSNMKMEASLSKKVEDGSFEEISTPRTNSKVSNVNVITREEVSNPGKTLLPGLQGAPIRQDAVVVMIRHGKTPHNELSLFTGWDDPPLAPEGIMQAREAGRLLKRNGFEFDVVYTSWLSRAIETAWLIMDEMGDIWLPTIKTWRLNERMYGSLTNLSKKMIAQKYGEAQLKKWRRGYTVRPPPVSSFSTNYPGNGRRSKYIQDVRYSLTETLIRSLEGRKLVLHRKLPKTECLKDCMDRTIPFFTDKIIPEAVNKGKRVLIASSENAIRGLLMKLCDIPEEEISNLSIPNGVPLIYNVKSQCIQLLEDEDGIDPGEKHDFGPAAEFLFKECLVDP